VQRLALLITFSGAFLVAFWTAGAAFVQATPSTVRVERLLDRPIIAPQLHPSIGMNALLLIRVPD
jgi:hypothetical protein